MIEKIIYSSSVEENQINISRNNFLLFGVGMIGLSTLQKLIDKDISPIAMIDDTPSKIGSKVKGINVISSKEALQNYSDKIIVVTILNSNMDFLSFKDKLIDIGFNKVYSFIDLYHSLPDIFLPFMHFNKSDFFEQNLPLINKSFQLFKEQKSKDIFLKNLDFRVNLNYKSLLKGDFDEYFPINLFETNNAKTFIDCGAYDADSILKFNSKFSKLDCVIAYEPDIVNFGKLIVNCSENKLLTKNIFYFNAGVWKFQDYMKFDSTENMASNLSEHGEKIIQVLDLDSSALPFINDQSNDIFLKMDIEGAEPHAIIGAKKLILNNSVNLAISIYHNPEDLFNIPLMISELNKNYDYYLRQHGNDSMDLVLYCKIKK